MDRAAADPSMLTDDPYHLAPSGGVEEVHRPSAEEMALPRATNAVLANGARLYVDHAHPEYSAPETVGAMDAVLWDRAGEEIARRIMKRIQENGDAPLVLVKNNTDGKGASYGTHENYQIPRIVDLEDVIRVLTPFFVTRPLICGAGRVGIGQKSEHDGFQISQRADFVEDEVGLSTTFNRPIVNTRDEPHADPTQFRRLHVIGGDGNLFDVSDYLKIGTTSLVLWAVEQGLTLEWEGMRMHDPVVETWEVSHHPNLDYRITLASGMKASGLDVQQMMLDFVLEAFHKTQITPSPAEQDILDRWQSVLDRMKKDLFSVATEVEWVAKYQLLSRQRERLQTSWADPRLKAMDLQWSDLRPDHCLVNKLDQAGRVTRLFTPQQVAAAADLPPRGTRAWVRGRAVAELPQLVRASWTSLVLDMPGKAGLIRKPLPDAYDGDDEVLTRIINSADL